MSSDRDNQTAPDQPTGWPANRQPETGIEDQRAAWRSKYADSDRLAGIEITEDFKPFNQRDDMFSRAFWDETIRSDASDNFFKGHRGSGYPRRAAGFSQKDIALRNASWAISDMVSGRSAKDGKREGFQAPVEVDSRVSKDRLEFEDTHALTTEIKNLAKLFGADLVGITDFDTRWIYESRVDIRGFKDVSHDLPEGMTHVIVMAHAMDRDLVQTYPSALAGAATGREYSHETAIVIQLTTYIRNLGYEAVGSMNDTGLVIPFAVKAGLGEYGRHQMVITPEFGPRVRFSKIFTNLPLEIDRPRRHGITEYCNNCTVCADACPPKALPYGPPDARRQNRSTVRGVKKWSANCEKCFGYWVKIGTDCAICMRVCPFNRAYDNWRDRLFFKLATSRFRALARFWDRRSGRGERVKPDAWWSRLAGAVSRR